MTILIIAILIGLIPAFVAQNKGRSFFLWWIYGAALWIVAMPHSLLLKSDRKVLDQRAVEQGDKKCPFCAEMIRRDAVVCRYCGKDQPPMTNRYGVPISSAPGG